LDENRRKAEKLLDETQPVLLIGSVMCTMFSVMKTLFRPHMGEEKFQKELKKARRHLNFVVSLYERQAAAGRYFLHEHPAQASSWQEECVLKMLAMPGVGKVLTDLCMFGHRDQDKLGNQMPIQKKMGFASNAPELLKKLERKCSRDHPHGCLLDGRAKASAVYPPELCQAIVEGFHAQMAADFDQFHKASGHVEDNRSAQIEVPLDRLEVAEDDLEDFGTMATDRRT